MYEGNKSPLVSIYPVAISTVGRILERWQIHAVTVVQHRDTRKTLLPYKKPSAKSSSKEMFVLGCGTGEQSAYLAQLVGPQGKIVGVDPDKERILLVQQSYSEIQNLSFVEGSDLNFPGIGSETYDIIFCNVVLHWIATEQTTSLQEYV